MAVAMLIDTTLCTGCRGCQVACKQWWDLPGEKTENRGTYENPPDLSPATWTRVTFHEVERGDTVRWFHMAWGCAHCTEAGCVEVCPTGALQHDAALGIVTLDRERCNGCGYCVEACPFGVPRLEGGGLFGARKVTKCNLCQDRVTNGLVPACAKTCPTGAIRFGDRAAMVERGRARVERLVADGLDEASLYGDRLLGGLGRMFVLGAPPEAYGLPADPKVPLAVKTWKRVARPLGQIALVGTAVGLAANWLVNLRTRRARKEEDAR
jgi:formate dehydrogenase iron-sulfur subunit